MCITNVIALFQLYCKRSHGQAPCLYEMFIIQSLLTDISGRVQLLLGFDMESDGIPMTPAGTVAPLLLLIIGEGCCICCWGGGI